VTLTKDGRSGKDWMVMLPGGSTSKMKRKKFSDLTLGDRFTIANGTVWTKIGTTTARKHSAESMRLGDRSYGYIGDPICSFEPKDLVRFTPLTSLERAEGLANTPAAKALLDALSSLLLQADDSTEELFLEIAERIALRLMRSSRRMSLANEKLRPSDR